MAGIFVILVLIFFFRFRIVRNVGNVGCIWLVPYGFLRSLVKIEVPFMRLVPAFMPLKMARRRARRKARTHARTHARTQGHARE